MVGWRWGGGSPGQWSLLGVATASCPGFVLFSWCESIGGEGEFGMTAATTAQVKPRGLQGGLQGPTFLSELLASHPKQHLTCCRGATRIFHLSDDTGGWGQVGAMKGSTRVGDSSDLRGTLPLHSLTVGNWFYQPPPRPAPGSKKIRRRWGGGQGESLTRMSWANNEGKRAREVFPSPPGLPEKYAPFH